MFKILFEISPVFSKLTEPGHQDMIAQTGTVPGHLEAMEWMDYLLFTILGCIDMMQILTISCWMETANKISLMYLIYCKSIGIEIQNLFNNHFEGLSFINGCYRYSTVLYINCNGIKLF